MFTVELYAGIGRALMVEELHYILLIAVDSERDIFCFAFFRPHGQPP
jgi:hypothetical protein